VRHDRSGIDCYAGGGSVGADDFQILRPLKAEVVDGGRIESRIPVRDENPLSSYRIAVGRIRLSKGSDVSIIRIGRPEIVKIKRCAHSVGRTKHIIQLSEPDVLILKARIGAEQSR